MAEYNAQKDKISRAGFSATGPPGPGLARPAAGRAGRDAAVASGDAWTIAALGVAGSATVTELSQNAQPDFLHSVHTGRPLDVVGSFGGCDNCAGDVVHAL